MVERPLVMNAYLAARPAAPSWRSLLRSLLQREWLQHRTGWLVLLAGPSVMLLLAASLADLQIDVRGADGQIELGASTPALLVTAGCFMVMMLIGLGVATISAVAQVGGLARRDVQDRSIAFWRALPVPDGLALAAPMLAQWLLLPLASMLAGGLGAVLVSLAMVTRSEGLAAWLGLPWGLLLPAVLAFALRLSLGAVLALLWLSPLMMTLMTASAWFKRWGVALVLITLASGSVLLSRVFGAHEAGRRLGQLIRFIGQEAWHSLFATGLPPGRPELDQLMQQAGPLLLADAGAALGRLAQPAMGAVLAWSALCFGLLLWRRQRVL